MKKLLYNSLALLLFAMVGVSCNLETPMHHYKPDSDGYANLKDVENNINGSLNQFASHRFYGRNVVALGDIASGLAQGSPKSGHFVQISSWTFNTETADLNAIWTSGYVVINNLTRSIKGANALLQSNLYTEDSPEQKELKSKIGQAKALKAYTMFTLCNIFALPYNAANANSLGIILVKDEPIEPKTAVTRAPLEECYNYILQLLDEAKAAGITNKSANRITPTAVAAFKAKVLLYKGNFPEAVIAADEAIAATAGAALTNDEYLASWRSIAISKEDIFTLVKSSDDNLSANSLNTLYRDYGARLTSLPESLMGANDIRLNLVEKNKEGQSTHRPLKFDGIDKANGSVSNIPVIRLSEVYLIAAEAKAQTGDITGAQTALLYTAKRDADITDVSKLPGDKDGLLGFIYKERVRELFQEGAYFFDLRRTERKATIAGVENYDISKFAYPIPSDEMDAGYLPADQQNKWKEFLPKK